MARNSGVSRDGDKCSAGGDTGGQGSGAARVALALATGQVGETPLGGSGGPQTYRRQAMAAACSALCTGSYVSNGRRAGLQGSPREGPDCAPSRHSVASAKAFTTRTGLPLCMSTQSEPSPLAAGRGCRRAASVVFYPDRVLQAHRFSVGQYWGFVSAILIYRWQTPSMAAVY